MFVLVHVVPPCARIDESNNGVAMGSAFNVADAVKCQQLCKEFPNCRLFLYAYLGNNPSKCVFKYHHAYRSSAGIISGPVSCDWFIYIQIPVYGL